MSDPQSPDESGSFVRSPDNDAFPGESAHDTTRTNTEEVALIKAMLENQPAAWRTFYAAYNGIIVKSIKIALSRSALVSDPDEELRDIHAKVYLSLVANDMHRIRAFDPSRGLPLGAWVALVTMNIARDHLRAKRREPLAESLTSAARIADDSADPFERMSERQHASIAQATLATFTERDQAFADLYFAEGLSPEDIASVLNISVTTVYTKKHKLQARLKALLGSLIPKGCFAA